MPYIIAILLVILTGIGFTLFGSNHSSTQTVTQNVSVEAIDQNAKYKDGTYNADASFRTPGGSYGMNVALTLANQTVTDVNVTLSGGADKDPHTQRFIDAYKTEVVGKPLNKVLLSRVGGASLTTNAFNQAATSIRAQAKI